jgi:hypothetical protein
VERLSSILVEFDPVPAYWLSAFVEEGVNNSGFDIRDVNPGLLELSGS